MVIPYSPYSTPVGEERSMAAYDNVLKRWPVPYESLNLTTRFGLTHLIACGPKNGAPVLLLHGQEASATMWFYNIRALSQSYRVYAVDTPGDIGKSRLTQWLTCREDYAAWLLDVLEQLHLPLVDLIGFSYGGFLALNFAIACPEKVRRLVLLAPGIPNFGSPTLQWAYFGMPMLVFPSRFTVRRFIAGASVKGYSAQDPVQEQMRVSVPRLRKRFFLRPAFQDEEISGVKPPCLLLLGDREILYDPAKAVQRACQLIPGLQAALIPQAGHLLNSDQPEMVNKRILRFLNEPHS